VSNKKSYPLISSQKLKKQTFQMLVLSIGILFFLNPLFREGLFMDGVIYAGLARNLSEGIGSVWSPSLSNNFFNTFFEHPPLAFYLEGVFFKLFDNRYIAISFYILLQFFIAFGCIFYLWKRLFSKVHYSLFWIPLLGWLSLDLNMWAYSNNMLEVTQITFIMLSFLCIYLSFDKKFWQQTLLYTLASFLILLGFLSNGPVALFPIGVIGIHWLIYRKCRFSRALLSSISLCIILVIVWGIFFLLNSDARINIHTYLQTQLFSALLGEREVKFLGVQKFYILWTVFLKFLPLLLLSAFCYFKQKFSRIEVKNFCFYTLIGLSAVGPIILSPKQSDYYALPAYPFFLLGILSLITPSILNFLNRPLVYNSKIHYLRGFSVIVFMCSIIYFVTHISSPNREKNLIKDLHNMQSFIPHNTTFTCASAKVCQNLHLHSYLALYLHSSMNSDPNNKYILGYKNKTDMEVIKPTQKIVMSHDFTYLNILENIP